MRKSGKITFIVNPVSGGRDKAAILRHIAQQLDPAIEREVFTTEHPGHAVALARDADADAVVADRFAREAQALYQEANLAFSK